MTITFTLPDLLSTGVILTVLAAGFSLYDGIARSRGKGNTVLPVVEIILAALLLASVFFELPIDVPKLTLVILLEVLLVLLAVSRGGGKGSLGVTIGAIVFNSLLLLTLLGWLTLPNFT
jgi:hypothetical protein